MPALLAFAVLVAFAAVNVVAPARAFAALGDLPLITYNMQGATSGEDSKWTTTVGGYAARAEIVALQEAGPTPPPPAPGTQLNIIPLPGVGLPPVGNAPFVQHVSWRSGFVNYEVYFLQTDPNGGTYVGGRNNVALVTQRPADEVTAIANPAAGGRAALGVRFGDTWYFTLHARAVANNEADQMVALIAAFAGGQGRNWVVMGDFNREPGNLPIPAGSRIYNPGFPTQQNGQELDYMVAAENVGGVQVNRLFGASSDHYAVALGALRAAAEPTARFHSDRAMESMSAGGVLDAYQGGTDSGTPIISFHRNGASNQSWIPEFYNDNSMRLRGRGSDRCIGFVSRASDPFSRKLSLMDCSSTTNALAIPNDRWFPEYVGDNEFQLHWLADQTQCMNVRGGPDRPDGPDIILYPCQNTDNERWLFTSAEATADPTFSPIDLSQNYTLPTTMESLEAGGVLDAEHGGTATGTQIISYHRNGGSNQGWTLGWFSTNTVQFRGVGSNRCIDLASPNPRAGTRLILADCSFSATQQWRAFQLSNEQVVLENVFTAPSSTLCMDIEGAPTEPDRGDLILFNCTGNPNQQWLFTSFDPTGTPVPDQPEF
jgi:endonuclease/exonuclease/phosphatase family metal-dependent hydrolase